MKTQLRAIDRLPRTLPSWQALLDDLGRPSAPRVARLLGVSVRTVHRWNATQRMPRSARLALFWLTRWVQSQVDADAVRDAKLAFGLADSLQRELARTRRQLAYVVGLHATGAANDPLEG